MLPSLFLFSVVWSLGASCDKAGRAVFDRCAWRRGGLGAGWRALGAPVQWMATKSICGAAASNTH